MTASHAAPHKTTEMEILVLDQHLDACSASIVYVKIEKENGIWIGEIIEWSCSLQFSACEKVL